MVMLPFLPPLQYLVIQELGRYVNAVPNSWKTKCSTVLRGSDCLLGDIKRTFHQFLTRF